MATLLDLLQSGQLDQASPLPDVLQRILQAAKLNESSMPDAAPAPGIAVGQPPMGLAPPMPQQQGVAPRQQAAAVPYAEMQPTAAPAERPSVQAQPAQRSQASLPGETWGQWMRNAVARVEGRAPDPDLQNQTYRALLDKGVEEPVARIAASNPSNPAAAQLLTQAFSPSVQKLAPDEALYDRQGRLLARNTDRTKPVVAGPGANVIDPSTGRVIGSGGLAPTDRADVQKTTTDLETIRAAREAMVQAKEYSRKALPGGLLANPDTWLIQNLPNGLTSQAQKDSANASAQLQNLSQNAALQAAKAQAGGRVTVYIDRAMQALAPNSNMPQKTREEIIDRTIAALDEHEAALKSRSEGIKSGNIYQPGQAQGGDGAQSWTDLGNGVRIRRTK